MYLRAKGLPETIIKTEVTYDLSVSHDDLEGTPLKAKTPE